MAKAKPKSAGRPPRRAGERLSKHRTFRVRGELDGQLAQAAAASGRSVSEEIEYRLERSFADDGSLLGTLNLAYGRELAGLMWVLVETMKDAGKAAGGLATLSAQGSNRWWNNPFAYAQAAEAAKAILTAFRPPGEPLTPDAFPGISNLGVGTAFGILQEIRAVPWNTGDPERGPRLRLALASLIDRVKQQGE
jgi:hypothetical protein